MRMGISVTRLVLVAAALVVTAAASSAPPERLMNQYRKDLPWFRANFHGHAHSNESACELVRAYVDLGYKVVGVEPWYLDAARETFADEDVLLISAPEDGSAPGGPGWPHLFAVAPKDVPQERQDPKKERTAGLQGRIDSLRDRGALVYICHPAWSGIGAGELRPLTGYIGIEIYNEAVQRINGKGLSLETWDLILADGKRVWGFAADDAHNVTSLAGRPTVGQGWVVIQAPTLTEEAIIEAIREGRFYSSMGPRFNSIEVDGSRLEVNTSPCVEVHFVGAGSVGQSFFRPVDSPGTKFVLDLSKRKWAGSYVRVEITDASGRKAWSNPLFVKP